MICGPLTQDWLLDGFPRTQGQATLLDQSLSAQGKPLNLVVNLDVPEEVILGRILGGCAAWLKLRCAVQSKV